MAEKKALTASEATICSIEKKMKMSLDDLISENSKKQNSQNSSTEKNKKKITTTQRFSNKTQQKPFHNSSSEFKDRPSRLQRYTDSRSSHRQAAFALRRSSFHETNRFSVAIDTGRRATTTISAPTTYRKPFKYGERIEKWNTREEDRYPPVQRREARVYVATKQWNDHRRTMVPKQTRGWNDHRRVVMPEQRHEYWKDQGRVVMPKQRHVEATKNKSVWQRLSGAPSRTQF